MAKTYRYRRYLILISSLFILLLCTNNSFTKDYKAPIEEQSLMLTAAQNLNLWLNDVKTCFNDVKTCYKKREYKKFAAQDGFKDLRNHFYFLESCMIEINERAKSCFISLKPYESISGRKFGLGSCIKDELERTQDAIENIAKDLPANLGKQGRDVSSQILSFELARMDSFEMSDRLRLIMDRFRSSGELSELKNFENFIKELEIENAYVKIFKIDAKINEMKPMIAELNQKIKELEEEKEQARGSEKRKIGKKIHKKETEVVIQMKPLEKQVELREVADQQKNEICQKLNIFSSDFSIFLAEMRKAYLLMLEIECCIITE